MSLFPSPLFESNLSWDRHYKMTRFNLTGRRHSSVVDKLASSASVSYVLIPFKPRGDLCLSFLLSFFQKEFLSTKSYSPCFLQPLAQTLLGVRHGRVTDPLRTFVEAYAFLCSHGLSFFRSYNRFQVTI